MRIAAVASMALLWCAAAAAQDTRVVLLGTGNPNPDPERSGPAVAVISGKRVYIVDCGPGIVRRAAQAGITMEQLTRAFVTHLHSDHTAGLPDLLFTPAVAGRLAPFDIYGPPGLRAMTRHVMAAWKDDREIRLHGLEPSLPAAYVVRAHEVKPGEIYRDAGMRVIAFAVNHGAWKYAYGFRFEAPDKTIAISGDTTYSPSLIAAARGVDILVHEVYSEKGLRARTPDWQRYHRAFHTSGADAGRAAQQAGVKTLVLYHQLPMGQSAAEVVDEVSREFHGRVIYGTDMDVIREP
jgi:ribonuclease BN (tRNA processing enzyme)